MQKIFDKAELLEYQTSEVIYNQGDPSPDFFFLLKGTVTLTTAKLMYPGVKYSVKTCFDG